MDKSKCLHQPLQRLLLTKIQDEMDAVKQWSEEYDWVAHHFQHYCRLEGLVELLEEYDCGSVGGFGKKQPEGQSLEERAQWLLAKYKNWL